MKSMKLAMMVEDFELYPRDNVSAMHVSEIVTAIENGADLPALIIDEKSKRIVDGFHRRRALIRVHGEGHSIDVVAKRYKSEADLFLDACRYNAHHGLRLDTHDKTTALVKGEKLGLSQELIAGALIMTVDKAAHLTISRTAKSNGHLVPLKRTIRHMAGAKISNDQIKANAKLSGMNQSFYVNQIITLIEADLLDTSDAVLMDRLETLRKMLDKLPVV